MCRQFFFQFTDITRQGKEALVVQYNIGISPLRFYVHYRLRLYKQSAVLVAQPYQWRRQHGGSPFFPALLLVPADGIFQVVGIYGF